MDYIFKAFKEIKTTASCGQVKRSGILDFQHRILELADTSIPILNQIEYIQIVIRNLKAFMIERIPDITDEAELREIITKVKYLMATIEIMIIQRNQKFHITIDDDASIPIVDMLYSSMLQSCYAEETDKEKIIEYSESFRKSYKPCIGFVDREEIIQEFEDIHPICWLVVPRIILRFSSYASEYKRKYSDAFEPEPHTKQKSIKQFKEFFYSSEKRRTTREILLRCPYDSYQTVVNFITEMCISIEIISIWITLYRVNPNNSKIVSALKRAALSGKHVFVFIEMRARGDEENNCKVYSELKRSGCFVKTDYFGYKVHGKMFLAMDKRSRLYGHIGTGNYNEKTATQYTDTHLITVRKNITEEMLNIFIALFEKKIYITENTQNELFMSPTNLRLKILDLIEAEIKKNKKGKIYIKVNNFCDKEIASLLHRAAQHHVDIRIICRTACMLTPEKTLQIRSKAGRYLEHDRLYIFGKLAFISSADLLFRNISKRVEILCKVNYDTMEDYFMQVWNSKPIFEITGLHSWKMMDSKGGITE